MSTNVERALDIADHIAEVGESPRELVKQLLDAGLLAAADHTEGNQK